MPNITIIDAPMGAGKTTHVFDNMNQRYANAIFNKPDDNTSEPPRFLFVSPFLKEIEERLPDECPFLDFRCPEDTYQDGSMRPKWLHLEQLLQQGHNVATTHALLPFLTARGREAIQAHGYELVIDEAIEATEIHKVLTDKERDHLLREGWIKVDEGTGKITWTYDHSGHRFEDVERLSKNGALYMQNNRHLIWEFPEETLKVFKSITVLTYLFEGSTLASYLRSLGYTYNVQRLETDQPALLPDVTDWAFKEAIRELLMIYQGPKNEVGAFKPRGANRGSQKFTKTHLEKWDQSDFNRLGGSLRKLLERDLKVSADKVAWTTFKKFQGPVETNIRGFSKATFIPVNARATNEFRDKEVMIYLANRYPNPALSQFIQTRGQVFDLDLYALSEMLQWLWRGCIRDQKPMTVFIPSERMRSLLKTWLEADTHEDLMNKLGTTASPPSLKAA